MPVFRKEDPGRLDWQLLQNGPITLYHHPPVLQDDLAWLRHQGYHVDLFDCASWESAADLHAAFASTLQFPDYYGDNLDALNDCLSELGIPDLSGRILVFYHFDHIAATMPKVAWAVLDIIAQQARRLLLLGQRLLALVQSDDPTISFEPVGACPVTWNSKEWLAKSRLSDEHRRSLEQHWQRTRTYLDLAQQLLAESMIELEDNALASVKDFLDHNELELALDELEVLGQRTNAPRQFWVFLRKAAKNMLLSEYTQRYTEKLKEG